VHIISIYPTGAAHKKRSHLGNLNSHWLGTVLSSLLTFHKSHWENTLKLSCITETFLALHHFSIHLNQFGYPEGGGSMFLQNIKTFSHYTLQKPKRIPLFDNLYVFAQLLNTRIFLHSAKVLVLLLKLLVVSADLMLYLT
jgi:hypothetical protein